MRLVDDRYVCALCGMQLDLAADSVPTLTIHAARGKPNLRVVTFDGVEIHRCEVMTVRNTAANTVLEP